MRVVELLIKIALPILGFVALMHRIKGVKERATHEGPVDKKIEEADKYYMRGATIIFLCVIPLVVAFAFGFPTWVKYPIIGVAAVGGGMVFLSGYKRGGG